ncbi:MAG: hypothetical protein GEU78_09525 [Actinobacteria bacterium]|nr:hypothetical protein [Actinomycetota bacterium]
MAEQQRITEQELAVYAHGLGMASACTSLTDEQATERINAVHPTGIRNPWTIVNEPFRDGTPNGAPCPDAPDTRRHLLFEC